MADSWPRIIFLGTQRAASTWLYNLLKSHPGLSTSEHKETRYYSEQRLTNKQYLDSFETKGIRIDVSPDYFIRGTVVAPRVKKRLGTNVRFLLVLRNPIDYLQSLFALQTATGSIDGQGLSVYQYVNQHPEYLENACYASLLKDVWFKNFSQEQFLIVSFEELTQQPDTTLRKIQEWLGVNVRTLSAPEVSKNPLLRTKKWYWLQNFVVRFPRVKNWLMRRHIVNLAYSRFAQKKITLPTEGREAIKKSLEKEVSKLKILLKRDFSEWEDFS